MSLAVPLNEACQTFHQYDIETFILDEIDGSSMLVVSRGSETHSISIVILPDGKYVNNKLLCETLEKFNV